MDSTLREAIRERARRVCEYCRLPEEYDRLPFQPDHIIAEKHRGPTVVENLAWSCYDCNMYKGPKLLSVFGVSSSSCDMSSRSTQSRVRSFVSR